MPLVLFSNRRFLLSQWLKAACYFLFVAFCVYVFNKVNDLLPFPFIDEIFHLRQCQTYCRYDFFNWDNKITTPPGLYIAGFLYSKTALLFSATTDFCQNINFLRSLNLVGGLIVFPLVLHLFKTFNYFQFWSVNVIAQPLLFTYYFLFYTDIWSTILIVWSIGLILKKPLNNATCWLSGLIGFASLWFRQTNIVWLAFVLSLVIDRSIVLERNQQINLWERITLFVKQFFKDYAKTIPYIINFVLFVAFLKFNGGITLGDNENHEISIHLVQVFYCFTFIVFFTWPVWLDTNTLIRYLEFMVGNYGFNFVANSLALVFIGDIIEKFTVVHPFLLADNRHYTFYIYKRLLTHKYSQIITIPLYHFATWAVISTLNSSKRLALSPLTIITFLGATCLTLIPSPLFEPRYYIVPLIIFRLFIKPVNRNRSILEFIWLNLINIFTVLVFINYEIKWDSEGDRIQRIIW